MSGHSKWATIKHKKGALDAKRGAAFTKIIRELTVAARNGGGNPDSNPRLRLAMQKAKDANMPSDNMDRAIKKGTGELEGQVLEEVMYEGYAPGGVALLIQVLSDNKNRTASEIRNIFSKKGGNMASQGAVAWMFEKKGLFVVSKATIDEDKLMTIALDAGADDMQAEDNNYSITTNPNDFDKVRKALDDNKIKIEVSELSMIPKNTVKVTSEDAKKLMSLIDELEAHDDVQNVYGNFDIPDDVMNEINKE